VKEDTLEEASKQEMVEVVITKIIQKTVTYEGVLEQTIKVPKELLDNYEFDPKEWFTLDEEPEFEEVGEAEYDEDIYYEPKNYERQPKKYDFNGQRGVSLSYAAYDYEDMSKALNEQGFKVTYRGETGETCER